MPSELEFHRINHDKLILKIYSSLYLDTFDSIKYPFEVSTSNSDACLHVGCCSDVHIVGTGHYVDGFTGIYIYICVCLYSGEWPLCGSPSTL